MKHAHKNGLIKISEKALNKLKDINTGSCTRSCTGSLNPNSKLLEAANEEAIKVIKYFIKNKLKTCVASSKQLAAAY